MAAQACEFGDAQPGLDCEQEERAVSASGPGGAVRGGEQRVDLWLGEIADQPSCRSASRGGRTRGRSARLGRGPSTMRTGRTSGSRSAARCGCGRCSRVWSRGAAGTCRSSRRRGLPPPASTVSCRFARAGIPATGGSRRDRRRSCAGWRPAAGPDARGRTLARAARAGS